MTTQKIRAQQIVLDLPYENAEVWVRAVLQTVFKDEDYQTVQTVDRMGAIHRQLSDFALQVKTITDPVTGNEITISGVGLGFAISSFVKQWILDDVPATIENQHGDIIKE